MTAAARLRPAVMVVALCATLGASAWTYWRNHRADAAAPVAAAVARPAPVRATPAPTPAAAAQADAAPVVDLFAPTTWEPPPVPPPPAAPVAPAPPQAPPMPFTYFGRTEVVGGSGGALIHLRRGKDVFSVREGETFEEHYRLDKVGADTLDITYLPLNEQQILAIGPR